MPAYISKAERERRAKWLTLPELLAFVRDQTGADNDGCLHQILNAIRDRKLRWLSQDPEPGEWSILSPAVIAMVTMTA
jgi:hypothetical protein